MIAADEYYKLVVLKHEFMALMNQAVQAAGHDMNVTNIEMQFDNLLHHKRRALEGAHYSMSITELPSWPESNALREFKTTVATELLKGHALRVPTNPATLVAVGKMEGGAA
jgi:hypothetical protein